VYHEPLVQFLHNSGATVYLVNPGRVRKIAEGIGILSKNDMVDADLLTRYGLLARRLSAPPVCSFAAPVETPPPRSEWLHS
jgi:hypothetical protein